MTADDVRRVCLLSRVPRPGVGDLVQRNIFLNLLRHAYPGARLTWVLGDPVQRFRFADDLVRHHCLADEIVLCPDAEDTDERRWQRFLAQLANRRCDVGVVDPRSLGLGVVEAHHAGMKVRIAVPSGQPGDDLITNPIRLLATTGGAPDLFDYARALAIAIGDERDIHPHHVVPRLWLRPEGLPAWVNERPLVGLHPGCSKGWNRRWPLTSFVDLAMRFVDEAEATLVILGSADEQPEATALRDRVMRQRPAARVRLSVGAELNYALNLIDRMDLLVGNDSGPAHLAAALATPTVVLYGTDGEEAMWRRIYPHHIGVNKQYPCQNRGNDPNPFDGQCALGCPCDYVGLDGPYPQCLSDITVAEVWQAVLIQLERASPGPRHEDRLADLSDRPPALS